VWEALEYLILLLTYLRVTVEALQAFIVMRHDHPFLTHCKFFACILMMRSVHDGGQAFVSVDDRAASEGLELAGTHDETVARRANGINDTAEPSVPAPA
jgi:hypothetical protein